MCVCVRVCVCVCMHVCVCVCSQASRSRATLSCDSSYFFFYGFHCGESKTQRKWFLDEKRDGLVDENRINNEQKEKQQKVYTPKRIVLTPFTQLLQTRVCFTNAGINNDKI